MKTFVVINLQVEGTHCWPECPFADVSFLRAEHRHLFYIRAKKEVTHEDRETEIILLKRKVALFISSKWGNPAQFGRISCETIARIIAEHFNFAMVEVLEDGENGAEVINY